MTAATLRKVVFDHDGLVQPGNGVHSPPEQANVPAEALGLDSEQLQVPPNDSPAHSEQSGILHDSPRHVHGLMLVQRPRAPNTFAYQASERRQHADGAI
jgi:hypothetical protein